jgi:capsid portal protein
MWPVRERITFRRRLLRKLIQVLHLKSQMREVRSNHNRPALVEFANLNFLVAIGRFQKNELRTAAGRLAANLFETAAIFLTGDRLVQLRHPETGV